MELNGTEKAPRAKRGSNPGSVAPVTGSLPPSHPRPSVTGTEHDDWAAAKSRAASHRQVNDTISPANTAFPSCSKNAHGSILFISLLVKTKMKKEGRMNGGKNRKTKAKKRQKAGRTEKSGKKRRDRKPKERNDRNTRGKKGRGGGGGTERG